MFTGHTNSYGKDNLAFSHCLRATRARQSRARVDLCESGVRILGPDLEMIMTADMIYEADSQGMPTFLYKTILDRCPRAQRAEMVSWIDRAKSLMQSDAY